MLFPLPIRVTGTRAPSDLPLANAGLILANVLGTLFLNPALWQIAPDTGLLTVATYSFIHAGLLHLLLNMWVLWVFGNAVNRRLGDAAYVAAYLGIVFAVGLAARFLSEGRVLGSAGGVFGVAAMAVYLAPRARVLFFLLAIFPLTLLVGLFRRPPKPIGWFVRWGWLQIALVWGLLLVPLLEVIGYLASLRWDPAHLIHLMGFAAGTVAVLLVPKQPLGPVETERATRVNVVTVTRADGNIPDDDDARAADGAPEPEFQAERRDVP
ncbi:MAG TPA: rhomboid family intramembrane serine protease [Planctomycetaceae bacterium]|nr:rhomboid family intramembrane serine protease [Planctomycetaceae bacterium]